MIVVDVVVEEEHSVDFSVVDARNVVVEEELVRIIDDDDTVLWWVEKAAAEEQDALTRSAAERMLLENFMVAGWLLVIWTRDE